MPVLLAPRAVVLLEGMEGGCVATVGRPNPPLLRFGTREKKNQFKYLPISTAQESARWLDQLETAVYCSFGGFLWYFTCKREACGRLGNWCRFG